MRAARLRGAAHAGVVILTLAFSVYGAVAEPLRLVVVSASAGIVRTSGEVVVEVRLADDSRRLFANFTQTNLGQMIDVRIDGKSVSKPVVREPITAGVVPITIGEAEEARRLATRLSDRTATLEVEAVPH
jgi:preprotein translocase subunit SecD